MMKPNSDFVLIQPSYRPAPADYWGFNDSQKWQTWRNERFSAMSRVPTEQEVSYYVNHSPIGDEAKNNTDKNKSIISKQVKVSQTELIDDKATYTPLADRVVIPNTSIVNERVVDDQNVRPLEMDIDNRRYRYFIFFTAFGIGCLIKRLYIGK